MKVNVLGVNFDALKKNEMTEKIKAFLEKGKKIFIVTPYSESLVSAQKNPAYKTLLNSADIAIPDGVGVLWAAHYLNGERGVGRLISTLLSIIFSPEKIQNPIPEKISGSSFVWDLSELAESNNFSIFLLGGWGDTTARAAKSLTTQFPKLKIAGAYAGSSPTEAGLVTQINNSRADFLFVAFGPEKQEKWIAENLEKLNIKLAIGLGGTFDYLAKNRPLVPKFWALRGLEWFWRLITQPWRVKRIYRGIFGLIYYTYRDKLGNRN